MGAPKPVLEYRFTAKLDGDNLAAFREALVNLAGAFTEIAGSSGHRRYIVGLRGRSARQRIETFLANWAPRIAGGEINLDDPAELRARDEIYFLLPIQRNPDPDGGKRLPMFTNEQLAALRDALALKFHFRPEMVQVYGQWRNASKELIPDHSFLIRVPRRNRGTVAALRRFIRREVLEAKGCDQDCIYLSSGWRGQFVARS